MKSIPRMSLLILTCFILSACAEAARKENMVVIPLQNVAVSSNHKLYKAISIGLITGGEETNPLWESRVNNRGFEEALRDSLNNLQFLSEGNNSRYLLDAHISIIDESPSGLTTFFVTSKVNYILKDKKMNKVIFAKTIERVGIATARDALIGAERFRVTNERSVRDNLIALMEELRNIQ